MLEYACEACGVTVRRARGDEGRGRFCSVKCGRAVQPMKSREERFWAKVDRRAPDECWPWTGTRLATGYGRMRTGPRGASIMESAHRISLEFKLGRPLNGAACHTCDSPPCCNPDHLYEGTPATNAGDRDSRQRNGTARITPDDVRLMRFLRTRGWTYQRIAGAFNITQTTAWDAIAGDAWRHVE